MARLSEKYGQAIQFLKPPLKALVSDGFLIESGDSVSLTAKGRLLSNEVFERLLLSGIPS